MSWLSWFTPEPNANPFNLDALLEIHGRSGTGLRGNALKRFTNALAKRNENDKRRAAKARVAEVRAAEARAEEARAADEERAAAEAMARIASNFAKKNSAAREEQISTLENNIRLTTIVLAGIQAAPKAEDLRKIVELRVKLNEMERSLQKLRRRGGRSFKQKRRRRRITRRN